MEYIRNSRPLSGLLAPMDLDDVPKLSPRLAARSLFCGKRALDLTTTLKATAQNARECTALDFSILPPT